MPVLTVYLVNSPYQRPTPSTIQLIKQIRLDRFTRRQIPNDNAGFLGIEMPVIRMQPQRFQSRMYNFGRILCRYRHTYLLMDHIAGNIRPETAGISKHRDLSATSALFAQLTSTLRSKIRQERLFLAIRE